MAKNAAPGPDNHQKTCIAGMVMMRIYMGAFFLFSVIADKLQDPAAFIRHLYAWTSHGGLFVAGNVWPDYARFLVTSVHPNANAFGWLIITGELVVGIMLLFGLLTRLAGFGALLLTGAYLLATLHKATEVWALNATFLLMALAVIIAAAGRTWGVDAFIARRTKLKLFW
jgi:uncharacterized membrane protein YphA (DoxX/SURF4 family)